MSRLDSKLLDILACPRCKGELTPSESHESLSCPECRLDFPVRSGVPILLMDQARPPAGED